MEIPRIWSRLNKIFYPEVRRIFCHSIFLVLNNTLENFEAFQRGNVVVRVFISNVTSWKQLCDLGVITVVKKRYKFLLFKDVL